MIGFAALAAAGAAVVLRNAQPAPPAALPSPPDLAPQAMAAARPGDALFKDGLGIWGRLAARFSENRDGYGHVGLVAQDADGNLVVIHAGGDPASREGRVQATPLADFLKSSRAAALYRPRLSETATAEALLFAAAAARRNTPFDSAFDLLSTERLYCTELVWRALSASLGEDAVPAKSERAGHVYIALDDLQESPFLEPVWRFGSKP